ncbi:radical SAM protein [Micromonospora sp. WMMD975]|uniref:radical SAM protein n=1 Tax=Micromonospora sp. WMMD975 TaxID=3016087 RepID=UPI00249CB2C3|nr:radical SAM protein [Micromonospora sp. WMMD975]WFE36306.1 radical SAM protein [Micromonospora sp. WMMD975]
MIGTRLDDVDAPRLIRGAYGWWFIGNQTWTLLRPECVGPDGTVDGDAVGFLRRVGAFRPRTPTSFSLTVLTTTTCNLGCGYCFQNTGLDETGGARPPRIGRAWLDDDVIDRVIAFTRDRMRRCEMDRLFLLLFGGEPLLNPRGCLNLLDRARTIGLDRCAMTTNGVLLTPRLARELYAAGLHGAQVTFDGSRADHDRIRVKRSGAPTFDTIMRNVARATEVTGLNWNLRVNVSHHNVDRIGDLVGELAADLIPDRCTVTFAWVGDAGFGYRNTMRHLDEVSDAFVSWSIAALEAGFRMARPGMRTTCQICSVPGGRYGAVVNADGKLFSCWQSAGKPGFEVGDVDEGYLDVAGVPERWVTCGYEYEQPDRARFDSFQDRVDGRLLDYLHTTGRL